MEEEESNGVCRSGRHARVRRDAMARTAEQAAEAEAAVDQNGDGQVSFMSASGGCSERERARRFRTYLILYIFNNVAHC